MSVDGSQLTVVSFPVNTQQLSSQQSTANHAQCPMPNAQCPITNQTWSPNTPLAADCKVENNPSTNPEPID
ncbi:hypothetical protein [Microcoleus vaginatus]|uniref:hypothetical protein n=1 Tax=Microcoleus vaginatus TaxID=119532 RepID=UPI00403F9B9D